MGKKNSREKRAGELRRPSRTTTQNEIDIIVTGMNSNIKNGRRKVSHALEYK